MIAIKKPTYTHLLLAMICLAAMNIINAYYYCIFIAIGVFCIAPCAKLRVDIIPTSMLLLIAVSWVAFSPSSFSTVFSPIKPFAYMLCYLIGSSMIVMSKGFSKSKTTYPLFYATVLSVTLGMLIHYILNWITNIGSLDRNTIDFWTKKAFAATGQASLACIPLALAIACLFSKNNKKVKIISIIALCIVMLYNLVLSGRTLIFMALIIAVISFAHQFIKQKHGDLRVLIIAVLIISLLVILYQSNLLGIKTYIESSPIYERFAEDETGELFVELGRTTRKKMHLDNMANYLWGGANIRDTYGYAHDIYLDTYDEAGILALIGIIIYMLVTVLHLWRAVRDQSLPFEFRQIVLCIYIAIYIEFMIEPILQGMPWLFALFCLIDGYVASMVRHHKNAIEVICDANN